MDKFEEGDLAQWSPEVLRGHFGKELTAAGVATDEPVRIVWTRDIDGQAGQEVTVAVKSGTTLFLPGTGPLRSKVWLNARFLRPLIV